MQGQRLETNRPSEHNMETLRQIHRGQAIETDRTATRATIRLHKRQVSHGRYGHHNHSREEGDRERQQGNTLRERYRLSVRQRKKAPSTSPPSRGKPNKRERLL